LRDSDLRDRSGNPIPDSWINLDYRSGIDLYLSSAFLPPSTTTPSFTLELFESTDSGNAASLVPGSGLRSYGTGTTEGTGFFSGWYGFKLDPSLDGKTLIFRATNLSSDSMSSIVCSTVHYQPPPEWCVGSMG
jgi:hypothetical protein